MHRSLFYPSALSSEEEEEAQRLQGQTRRMLGVLRDQGDDGFSTAAMSDLPPLPGADSLDDIVSQNSHELQRRRSVGLPYGSSLAATARQTGGQDELPLSMVGFNNAFQGFQFGHDVAGPHADMASGLGGFVGLPAGQTRSSFPQPGFMTMSAQPDYATLSNVDMAALANSNMGPMGANPPSIDAFGTPDLGASYGTSAFNTANPDFSMDMAVDTLPLDSGISFGDDGGAMMGGNEAFNGTGDPREPPPPSMMVDPSFNRFQPNMAMARSSSSLPTPASFAASSSSASATPQHTSSPASVAQPSAAAPSPAPSSSSKQPATAAAAGPALPPGLAQHNSPQKKARNVYSRSGFDMLRALWYVATRKNPTLRIGAVDMSCSFVVCDVTLNDCPIVYVSDNFEKLTGYSRHEILGQNCRFLQSPTGKVEAGSRREFVENGAVFNLKRAMDERREIQQGIINYRKGGRPFLNLLTMVFIPWDDTPEGEIKYCVGFQIDLVECPEAVSAAVEAATGETERHGIVSVGGKDLEVEVDYRRVEGVGPYIKTTPPPLPATSSSREADLESGQTISVDDVSGLLQQLDPGGPSSDWHRHAWDKMLLENADDLVHVLSLKGLFLYLSPACKRLLEYDVGDLVGNSLSSVCHPSDIVPVMRELKEVQVNVPVNLVFRIRRKHSGYMWFESHGTLLGEQGKGRRCVMLVGRRRPVYALQRRDVDAHGGIGSADGEFWSKLSASGMFLFASSGVRSLLDLQPAELEGTSMHDLLRKESRDEFGRAVEKARRGAIVTLKHTLAYHRRGQPLQVQTTFYPGDASEPGQKNPSFLIAQTRAIKPPPRAIASSSAGGRSGGATEDAIMKGVITAEDSPAAPQPQDHQQLPTAATLEAEDDDNMFDELKTTRCTSWQYELRQMEKVNRLLAGELTQLMASKKKRKRRKRDGAGAGAAGGGGSAVVKDCANCHKRDTPEWRRGPSGNRDLCNSCGLRWAKQTGKVLPRTSTSRAGSVGTSADAQSNKRSGNSSPVLSPVSITTTAGTGALPPQSNPLFGAGASGAGGLPMEMTAIWEAEEGREGGVGP